GQLDRPRRDAARDDHAIERLEHRRCVVPDPTLQADIYFERVQLALEVLDRAGEVLLAGNAARQAELSSEARLGFVEHDAMAERREDARSLEPRGSAADHGECPARGAQRWLAQRRRRTGVRPQRRLA